MAKKVTKKPTAKSKTTKAKKAIKKETTESGSFSIIILAIVGIILLVYFGTSSEVSVDVKVGNDRSEELIEDSAITISGTTYNSSKEAYTLLKEIPQTQRTNDETRFVESYK
tara:strand:+ start:526 stop:861 length:336 start_codon:yes stop_codon:yes gene_type:complete